MIKVTINKEFDIEDKFNATTEQKKFFKPKLFLNEKI